MRNKRFASPCPTWFQVVILLLLTCVPPSAWADLHLPSLKSGTVTYSNVTVYSQTEQDLYISHAQGLGNIKISTLDDASLRALGLKGEQTKTESGTLLANARVAETVDKLKNSLGHANLESASQLFAKLRETSDVTVTPVVLGGTLAVMALLYLFFCFCLKLICRNAGEPAGVLIWFPFLQMFPLLRAAKMPAWHFLLFLVPLVNIGMQIWWSFRIAKACGKSNLVAVALILPVLNLLAFLYLAFSPGQPEEPGADKPVRLEGLASA